MKQPRLALFCLVLLLTGCATGPSAPVEPPAAVEPAPEPLPTPDSAPPDPRTTVTGPQAGPLPGAPLKAERVADGWRYGPVPSVWTDSLQWLPDGRLFFIIGVNPNPLAGSVVLDLNSGAVEHLPYAADRWGTYELVGSSLLYYTMKPELLLVTAGGPVLRWEGWQYTQSPDGRYLVLFTGDRQNELRRVPVAAPDAGKVIDFGVTLWSRKVGTGTYWSPDGKYLAVEPPNAAVRVIDVEAWQVVATLPEGGRLQVHGGWSPDSKRLALRLIPQEGEPGCITAEGDRVAARRLVIWEPLPGKLIESEPVPGRWLLPWGARWTDPNHLRLPVVPEGPVRECTEPGLAQPYYYEPGTGSLTSQVEMDAAALLQIGDAEFSPDRQFALVRIPTGSSVNQVLFRSADGAVVKRVSDQDWQLGPWAGNALVVLDPAYGTGGRRIGLMSTAGEVRLFDTPPSGSDLPFKPVSPDGRWYAYRQTEGGAEWLVVKAVTP